MVSRKKNDSFIFFLKIANCKTQFFVFIILVAKRYMIAEGDSHPKKVYLSKTAAGICDSLGTTIYRIYTNRQPDRAIEISILSGRNFVSCAIDRFARSYWPYLAAITLDF